MSILGGITSFFASDGGLALALLSQGAMGVYNNERATAANIEAARISAEGALAEARAIEEGNRLAQERYAAIQQQTAPAQSYLRGVVVQDPTRLTPLQENQMADLRRDTNAALAASGLRGAGRATVAAIRQVEDQARNRMVDGNRARQDSAASQLSGQFNSAATNSANLDAATGRATGSALRYVGGTGAGATVANEQITGKTMGDLTSLVASELKERGRESRFRDRVADRTGDENFRRTGGFAS